MKKTQFTPNGVSFKQIKQDAKRLSKKTEITHQQALNKIVSESTNFTTWEKLEKHCKLLGGSILKYSYKGLQDVVFANKPIVFITNEGLLINQIIESINSPMKPTVISFEDKMKSITGIKEHLVNIEGIEAAIIRSEYVIYKEPNLSSFDFEEFKQVFQLCKEHKKALFFINNSFADNGKNLVDYMKYAHRILEPIQQAIPKSIGNISVLSETSFPSTSSKQAIGRMHRTKKTIKIKDILDKN